MGTCETNSLEILIHPPPHPHRTLIAMCNKCKQFAALLKYHKIKVDHLSFIRKCILLYLSTAEIITKDMLILYKLEHKTVQLRRLRVNLHHIFQ